MENSLPIHTPPCDRACADAYRWEVSASDLFAVLDETLLRRLDGSSDRGARGDAGRNCFCPVSISVQARCP